MKKLFISLLLINLFTANIYADTYTGSHSISLSLNVEPTYSVKIPKQLDISNNVTNFNYYVCGDIYADQRLLINFDSETKIYSSNKYSTVYISFDKTEFTQSDLSKEYVQYNASIVHDELDSGTYTGQLNVVISLIGGA